MDSSSRIIQFLAGVPQFSAMDAQQLTRLYGFTALKVLSKGDAATLAGGNVDDLCIVVSGRLAEHRKGPEAQEFGQGAALAAEAFFSQRPASATLIALRETMLLTLSWADLTAAFRAHPDLLEACFATFSRNGAAPPASAPSRLVLCAAGAKGRLDAAVKDAFVSALEGSAEVRILRRESFGSLALDAPDTAHWLQEQELEFDVTVVVADGADASFAKDAVEEGDDIVFIASSGSPALTGLEQHALDRRGKNRCRLIIAKDTGISLKNAADWIAPRPYRSTQLVDFASPKEAALMAATLLGKGIAVAATSCGVYAASILGALQAFEANGAPPSCLAAAGSAILPAGLACEWREPCRDRGGVPGIGRTVALEASRKAGRRIVRGCGDRRHACAGLARMQHRPHSAAVHRGIALTLGERTQAPPRRPPSQRGPRRVDAAGRAAALHFRR